MYQVSGHIPGLGSFVLWVPAVSGPNAIARVQDAIPDADIDLAELESTTSVDDLG